MQHLYIGTLCYEDNTEIALQECLQVKPNLDICYNAKSVTEFIRSAELFSINIALIEECDKQNETIDLLKMLQIRHHPYLKIIVLTKSTGTDAKRNLIEAGATGFLQINNIYSNLFDAMNTVSKNSYYFTGF